MKTINYYSIILLACVTIAGCSQPKSIEKTDDSVPVKVIAAASLSENEPVETSGLLSSDQQSNLSFKTGGIINRILVKEGDRVSKGQLLATLNMTEVNAQLSQAEENYNKTKRDAQRIANMYKDSVSTKEQYEHTQTAMVIAKKQLDIAKFNTTQSSITANTDGVVLKKLANEGEQVAGGNPVLFISGVDNKDWIIKCGITDKDRSRIKGGEKAEILFDILPEIFTGSIKTLAQGSDSGSGLYQVEICMNPSQAKLISGLFAKVKIYPFGKADLLSIPMDALVEGKNDSAFVYTAVAGKALRQSIKVAYLKGDKVFVSSGIKAEDQVIREGSAYLSDGSAIRIVK